MIAQYVESRRDTEHIIRARINTGEREGRITEEYRATLASYLEACIGAWRDVGKIVDERDPKDWASLGSGAKMKVKHEDKDYARDDGID